VGFQERDEVPQEGEQEVGGGLGEGGGARRLEPDAALGDARDGQDLGGGGYGHGELVEYREERRGWSKQPSTLRG
jgi:hypothetical protein